jgi:hypothetical protein
MHADDETDPPAEIGLFELWMGISPEQWEELTLREAKSDARPTDRT